MAESKDDFNIKSESNNPESNNTDEGDEDTVCWLAVASSIVALGSFVGFLIVGLLYLTLRMDLVDCGIPNTDHSTHYNIFMHVQAALRLAFPYPK